MAAFMPGRIEDLNTVLSCIFFQNVYIPMYGVLDILFPNYFYFYGGGGGGGGGGWMYPYTYSFTQVGNWAQYKQQ